MKALILSTLVWVGLFASLSAEESRILLQDALFAEEARQDHATAIQKYSKLLEQFKKERQVAVVALYRLAEIHRKQGNKRQAADYYRQLLDEFPGMEPHNRMSRANLVVLGEKLPESGAMPLDVESRELARLKKIETTSPDLFKDPANLEKAASENWLRVMAYLIKKGADVNRGGALDCAAGNGHLAACQLLIKHGCDLNAGENSEALWSAFSSDYTEVIKCLLRSGVDLSGDRCAWLPNSLITVRGAKPLSQIQLIIEAGCNINVMSTQLDVTRTSRYRIRGGGLLHAAVMQGDDGKLLKYLLSKNPDLNAAPANTGFTALHLAVLLKKPQYVQRLIKAGANTHATCSEQQALNTINGFSLGNATPMTVAVAINSLESARVLLAAKASLPEIGLDDFAKNGQVEWMQLFAQHGADLHKKNKQGYGLVGHALANRQGAVALFLLKKQVSLHSDLYHYLRNSGYQTSETPEISTLVMTRQRYPEFAKRKGITVALPTMAWDRELLRAPASSSALALALYNLHIPQAERRLSDTGKTLTQWLWQCDTVKCSLIRQGQALPLDFSAKDLPDFQAGDIIEFKEFSASATYLLLNKQKHNVFASNKGTTPIYGCAFAVPLRRHITIPIILIDQGQRHELTLHEELTTYDPRTKLLPRTTLGPLLHLLGIGGEVSLKVQRSNWQPIILNAYGSKRNIFELRPGDLIEVIREVPEQGAALAITVTVPGKFFKKQFGLKPLGAKGAWGPSLLQILMELNQGRQISLAEVPNPSATLKFKQWQQSLYWPSNRLNTLLLHGQPSAQLYNIDFSDIMLRRASQNGKGKDDSNIMRINLDQMIQSWDGSPESAKALDLRLRAGDTIELRLKEGKWLGYTPRQKSFIEAALSYKVMCLDEKNAFAPHTIQYRCPTWISTRAGLIPIHTQNQITGISGYKTVPGKEDHISVTRAGRERGLKKCSYWIKDEDQISAFIQRPPPNPTSNSNRPSTRVRRVPRSTR